MFDSALRNVNSSPREISLNWQSLYKIFINTDVSLGQERVYVLEGETGESWDELFPVALVQHQDFLYDRILRNEMTDSNFFPGGINVHY